MKKGTTLNSDENMYDDNKNSLDVHKCPSNETV